MKLDRLTVPELFALWSETLAELARRGAIRSANSPVADYAELLVAGHYGVEVQPKSTKGYDILSSSRERLEVKALRRTQRGRTTLSRIADLNGDPGFDAIVIVEFSLDCSTWRAWHVPLSAVRRHARYHSTWKGPRLSLTRRLIADDEVTELELRPPATRRAKTGAVRQLGTAPY
jgi:hypothetical protein